MSEFAWVTLATNDSYSLGALVLAHSLRQVGTAHQLAVLVTPGVTNSMREKLTAVFNVVKVVNILDSKDEANLRLLQRPELGITFTKLHCWRLTQFKKCVFLDADTMVLANVDELFEREELSAAPDVGWPDCFNSGVFVYRPSEETYANLIQFAIEKGSFDGGDQGLLNLYFSDWAHKDISKHLPFIYNMCSTACYSYLPAFKQFGDDVKIIHFIGNSKPWLQYFDTESRQVQVTPELRHLQGIVQQWWNTFCSCIHPVLSPEMTGLAGAFAQLTLGVPRTAEQNFLEDHLRRQGWEVGNIDYMGRDSFDNIWSKICLTLSSPPEPEVHPPAASDTPTDAVAKEPSPPPAVKQVEKTVEVAELCTSAEEITPAKEARPVADSPITQSTEISQEPSKPESQVSAEPSKVLEIMSTETADVPAQISAEETIIPTEATLASQQPPKMPTSEIVAPAISTQPTQMPVESTVVTESTPSITSVSTEAPIEPIIVSQPAKSEATPSPKIPTSETAVPVMPVQTQMSTEPIVVCESVKPEVTPSPKTPTSVSPAQTQILTESTVVSEPTQSEIAPSDEIPASETVTSTVPLQIPPIKSTVSEPVKSVEKPKSDKQVETSEIPQQTKTESTTASVASDVSSQVPKPITPPVTPTTQLHKQKPSTPTEQKQDVCSKPAQISTIVSQKPEDTSKTTGSQTKPAVAQAKAASEKPVKKELSQSKSPPAVKEASSASPETASAGDAQGPTPPPRKSGSGGSGNKKGGKGKK